MERTENIEVKDEMTTAENGVENVTESDTKAGIYIHKLSEPFEHSGKIYEKFEFDFEKLTGKDMVDIENEMSAVGEYAISPEISTSFLSRMAAKAAGVGSDVILKLPIKEFGKIKNVSRDFLIGTGF